MYLAGRCGLRRKTQRNTSVNVVKWSQDKDIDMAKLEKSHPYVTLEVEVAIALTRTYYNVGG